METLIDDTIPHHLSDQVCNSKEDVIEEFQMHNYHGVCAICLKKILLQETALVKGCEHAYCVTCILRWATYKKEPTCPQCKIPFEFLNIHRSLDGRIHDYMFEESVCLLLRASWFNPSIKNYEDALYDVEDNEYPYVDEDLDDVHVSNSSNIFSGCKRWDDNGYVREGKQKAKPAVKTEPNMQDSFAGPSWQPKKKEVIRDAEGVVVGRRAKRTLKHEAADKAAAAKHQQLLTRLGRI